MGLVDIITRFLSESVMGAGFTLLLLGGVVYHSRNLPRRRGYLLEQLYITGVRPLPVIIVVGVFTGMILALQTGVELDRFGQKESIAYIIGTALCREMGPFMTALILTASVGSGMAAEIGTMKVSEEIDALEVMSINPVEFLVLPRVVALSIMCPLLTLVCDLVGIVGGGLVGQAQFNISLNGYFNRVIESLSMVDSTLGLPKDLYTGLFKAWIFGIVIAAVGCSSGLRAAGGALGVGQATRNAVINAFLLIIILGYYMTWFFYR